MSSIKKTMTYTGSVSNVEQNSTTSTSGVSTVPPNMVGKSFTPEFVLDLLKEKDKTAIGVIFLPSMPPFKKPSEKRVTGCIEAIKNFDYRFSVDTRPNRKSSVTGAINVLIFVAIPMEDQQDRDYFYGHGEYRNNSHPLTIESGDGYNIRIMPYKGVKESPTIRFEERKHTDYLIDVNKYLGGLPDMPEDLSPEEVETFLKKMRLPRATTGGNDLWNNPGKGQWCAKSGMDKRTGKDKGISPRNEPIVKELVALKKKASWIFPKRVPL